MWNNALKTNQFGSQTEELPPKMALRNYYYIILLTKRNLPILIFFSVMHLYFKRLSFPELST